MAGKEIKGKHEKKRKTASCWRDGNQMVYRDGRFTDYRASSLQYKAGSEKTPPLRPVRRLRRLAARNSIFISIFFEIRFLSMLHKNSQLNIKSAGGMCAGAVCLGGGERGRDDTPLLSDHPDGLPACCAQAHVLSPDDSAQED
jgi:hypothetical protein